MINRTIPTKTSFSKKDYDEWKLDGVDFYPFQYQEEFAEAINKIAEAFNMTEEFCETLRKAKAFACSTIIPDGTSRGFSRVFFETPEDLKHFIENYQEEE